MLADRVFGCLSLEYPFMSQYSMNIICVYNFIYVCAFCAWFEAE